jgi:drug/metabolite transporter (DMT)-like permease
VAGVTRGGWRTAALTAGALSCFAANSLLCRLAMGAGRIDAATFTSVRLTTGAATMALLLAASGARGRWRSTGSWASAAVMFVYAVPFSLAYLRLGAGLGALVLFGTVQVTMIGWGLWRGERPRPAEWIGLGVATAGLGGLTAPGLTAPDPVGVALMAMAGVAWAAYSLRGRNAGDPLAATTANFVRTLPLAAVLALVTVPRMHASATGVALAAASGAVASGLGYTIWYAALRGLTATRAAILQLAVPVLAALGGVLLMDERITPRLVGAGAAILGGVAVAVVRPRAAAAGV